MQQQSTMIKTTVCVVTFWVNGACVILRKTVGNNVLQRTTVTLCNDVSVWSDVVVDETYCIAVVTRLTQHVKIGFWN